jgi:hypothetical protein
MRFSKRYVVMASVLLASTLVWGQQPQIDGRTSVLVRMSFTSSWVDDFGDRDLPQVCFLVDDTGHYQMRRLTMKVNSEPLQGSPHTKLLLKTPHTELLQGILPPSEFRKLRKLLGDPEFLKLTTSAPSILRKGAETFVAEVPRENGVQRVVMSDADGENPFPPSADKIVNWLQHFKAEGAESLDVSAEEICPSGALQPVNPATASTQPIPASGACVRR